MTSSFHKIYRLAVHTKRKGLGPGFKKIAFSGSQNAGSVWTKRQYDTKYLSIQLNVCLCVRDFTVISFCMSV